MSTIRTSLTRRDLLSANASMLWRLSDVWVGWAFWTIVIGVLIAWVRGIPVTPRQWLAILVGATVGAFVTQLITVGFVLWRTYRLGGSTEGVLGEHEYSIRDDGLREKTAVNETLSAWSSVKSLRRTRRFIFIEVPRGAFHFIPASAFATQAECDQFWQSLRRHAKEAV